MATVLAIVIILVFVAGVAFWFGGRLAGKNSALEAQKLDEALRLLEERLPERFKAAAADALRTNQETLISQARLVVESAQKLSTSEFQTQGGRLQLELQKNLLPLQESLKKLETHVNSLEQSRVGAYASLDKHLEMLSLSQRELTNQTSNLVRALREPKARGSWGELQLKRAVEYAGLTNRVDFTEQTTAISDSGDLLRPDMVVNLPNGRRVVVDAKVPMTAYLDALNAGEPTARKDFFALHAKQVRAHFKKLGEKQYWRQFTPAPEFVVMFLHAESILAAALEQEPGLIEDAIQEHVLIATPTTLIALLKSVAYGWGDAQATQKAREVVELGNKLMEDFSAVAGNWQDVGYSLEKAVEKYNQAATTTQRRLIPAARKLRASPELEDFVTIDVAPKELEVKAKP